MLGKIYYLVSALIFLVGLFIFITPTLLTPNLIFPERIDSTYMSYEAIHTGTDMDTVPLTPSDMNLVFSELKVKANDGILLKGWYVSAADTPANTIVIIHNLNESSLLYLDHLKQFHDRGLNVAVFDLRAHGSSGGNEFSPGLPAVNDVRRITDSVLAKKGTRNLVYFGSGIGAAIALQSAVYDDRCKGLILQNPFSTFESYIETYANEEWGSMKKIWLPVFKRRITKLLHYPIRELDLRHIASYTSMPFLFIVGSDEDKYITTETLQVYDAAASDKKELFLVRNVGRESIAKAAGEAYYNRIAAFIVSSMPKEQKISRYKRFAFLEK